MNWAMNRLWQWFRLNLKQVLTLKSQSNFHQICFIYSNVYRVLINKNLNGKSVLNWKLRITTKILKFLKIIKNPENFWKMSYYFDFCFLLGEFLFQLLFHTIIIFLILTSNENVLWALISSNGLTKLSTMNCRSTFKTLILYQLSDNHNF